MPGASNRFEVVTQHLTSSAVVFFKELAKRDAVATYDALRPHHREGQISAPVWDFLIMPFDTLSACEQIFYEMSFLDHSNKRAADIADLYSQVLTEVELLTEVIDYATTVGEYPTSAQFAAQKRRSSRPPIRPVVTGTSEKHGSSLLSTAVANALKLKQALQQMSTLVQTRLDMVYLYESLLTHPKTYGDFTLEIETLRRVVLEGLNSINHEYLAAIVHESRMEVSCLIQLLTVRTVVLRCRYVEAILGVAELKRQLSIWTGRCQAQQKSGSVEGPVTHPVHRKTQRSGSGEWSFFGSIIKAITGASSDDEQSDRAVSSLMALSGEESKHIPRTMAAAKWMLEYASHLTAKLELCTEHIRARIYRSKPLVDPATLTSNRFTNFVEDVMQRTATCSQQAAMMLIGRSSTTAGLDLKYAYLCPEPDSSVQESLIDAQLRKASWMTSGEEHYEDRGIFADATPIVRTITGEDFMQLLPSGSNTVSRSRGSSVDSSVRHILSDSSLLGVGAMIPMSSSETTTQSITVGSADNLAFLELTKNTFSDSDLPAQAQTTLRSVQSLPSVRFDVQQPSSMASHQQRSTYSNAWVPLFFRTSAPYSSAVHSTNRPVVDDRKQEERNDISTPAEGFPGRESFEYVTRTCQTPQSRWFMDHWAELTAALDQSRSVAQFSAESGCPINKEALRVFSTKSSRISSLGQQQRVLFVHCRASHQLDIACVILEPRKQCEQILRDFVSKFARDLRDDNIFDQLGRLWHIHQHSK